jgi:8-amino-7-oxononanoate synthase
LAAQLQGRENIVTLATCGKAMGCEGALILAPAMLRDFLVNRGRGFIFSTAPSPLIAAIVRKSLAVIARADELRGRLRELIARAGSHLGPLGIPPTGTHIQPVIVGEDARTMRLAAALQDRGFDVRGIRPPTVPAGTARLRISITLNTDETEIAELADALGDLL